MITDLDSVNEEGRKCVPGRNQKQKSNNDTLKSWHPNKEDIDSLLDIPKLGRSTSDKPAPVFVAYQTPFTIGTVEVLARTFEDALILANFDNAYFQDVSELKAAKTNFEDGTKHLSESLFDYVNNLSKGNFAFSCLFYISKSDKHSFITPEYISEGLAWLEKKLSPSQ